MPPVMVQNNKNKKEKLSHVFGRPKRKHRSLGACLALIRPAWLITSTPYGPPSIAWSSPGGPHYRDTAGPEHNRICGHSWFGLVDQESQEGPQGLLSIITWEYISKSCILKCHQPTLSQGPEQKYRRKVRSKPGGKKPGKKGGGCSMCRAG